MAMTTTAIISIIIILVIVGIVLAFAYPYALAEKKKKVERTRQLVHDAALEIIKNRNAVNSPEKAGKPALTTSAVDALLADPHFNAFGTKEELHNLEVYREIVDEIVTTGEVVAGEAGNLVVRCEALDKIGGRDDFEDLSIKAEALLQRYLKQVERERVEVEKVR